MMVAFLMLLMLALGHAQTDEHQSAFLFQNPIFLYGETICTLHDAAQECDTQSLQALLAAGVDPNSVSTYAETALHRAMRYNCSQAIDLLLHYGASVEAPSFFGTPLHIASWKGFLKCVEKLLHQGASVKSTSIFVTMHQRMADENEPEEIIGQHYKNVSSYEEDFLGETSLHSAATFSHPEIISVLLQAGADAKKKSFFGTPIAVVASNGCAPCLRVFISAQVSLNDDSSRWSALSRSAFYGHTECLEILLAYGAQDGYSSPALHEAIKGNHVASVKILLAHGYSTQRLNSDWLSPLHLAAQEGTIEIMDLLVKYGSGVNEMTLTGTPLHHAARAGKKEAVEWLLAHGAWPNQFNYYFETPLHSASQGGHTEIIHLLVRYAVHHKTKPFFSLERFLESIQRLAQCGEDAQEGFWLYRKTPLNEAIKEGHEEAALLLIAYGAPVNVKDKDGLTPLNWAHKKGMLRLVDELLKRKALPSIAVSLAKIY